MSAIDDLIGNSQLGNSTQLPSLNTPPQGGGVSSIDQLIGNAQPKTQPVQPNYSTVVSPPPSTPSNLVGSLHDVTNPWDGVVTFVKGGLNDIGQLASGLGKIAYTPIQVTTNLFTGKDAFDHTIIQSIGSILSGAAGNLTGGQGTPEWDAIKSYYGEYTQHPLDMVLNHPVNTILDIASILDAGATSAGAISKIGEVGDLAKAAEEARLAGDTAKADELASQAQQAQAASTSGQIADKLHTAQNAINPFSLGGKAISATFNAVAKYSDVGDKINQFVRNTISRASYFGLNPNVAQKFTGIIDRFDAENLAKNNDFREAFEPVAQPFINNPALADRIADGMDRPALLTEPYEIALRDSVQKVFDQFVTEPERAGKLLKSFIDSGYLEHYYMDEAASQNGFAKFRSFRVNAPNDKATQVLNFSPLEGEDKPVIGTAKFNNYTELNKDAEIEKIEQSGSKEITRLQKENEQLTKGLFDNQLQDLIDERKKLLAERSQLTQRKIEHPEDFQTDMGHLGNALDNQEKVARAKLIENNLKLKEEIERLKNSPQAVAQGEGEGGTKLKFEDPQDKLIYNYQRMQEIQNEIAVDSAKYNTNLRLFKNSDGNILKALRPTSTELRSINMQPADLLDAIDHRAKRSFLNQTKLELGDQLGKEFGTLDKPESMISTDGQKIVQSKFMRTPEGQFYYVPENIERAAQMFSDTTTQGAFLSAMRASNNLFKRLLFALPTSAIIHLQHLGYLGYLGGGLDFSNVIRQIANKGDAIDAEFSRASAGSEVKGGFFETRGETLKEDLEPKSIAKKVGTAINPVGENFIGAKLGQKSLEVTDDFLRRSIYRAGIKDGLTSEQSMAKVNSYMGNFADITPNEKYLQALFPFYSWMKRSLPVSARAITENAARLDIPRFLSGGVNLNPNAEEQKGKFDTGQKDANGAEIFRSASVPLDDIRKLFQDMPDYLWTRTSPVISATGNALANRDQLFNSDPNFAKLNQVYDPNLDPASKALSEVGYIAGKIANPFATLMNNKTLDEKALNSIGVYSSSYDPLKADYYSRKDALAAVKDLQKQYDKAVASHNLIQASFYKRAMQAWQSQINGQ